MRSIWTIFRRETAATFDTPIAYIFACVFLMLTCGIFMNDFFLISLTEMDGYFDLLPYILAVFVPSLSMRLWAEDRKFNTYELLVTLPLRDGEIVLGKYLASLFIYSLVLAGSLPIVWMLYRLGHPDGGRILASYLGALMMGGFILAFGTFVSALTKDQIVAYLVTLLFSAIFVLSGNEKFSSVTDGLWPKLQIGSLIRDNVSALPHYETLTQGVIDIKDALYFLSLSAIFLFMNLIFIRRDRR